VLLLFEVVKNEPVRAGRALRLVDPEGRVVCSDEAVLKILGAESAISPSMCPAGQLVFMESGSRSRKLAKGQRVLVEE